MSAGLFLDFNNMFSDNLKNTVKKREKVKIYLNL